MGPLANVAAHADSFRIDAARGAVTAQSVAAGAAVGIFVYWEWGGVVPVTASSLAPAVGHARGDAATCELAPRAPDSDVQELRARKPLPAGARITLDYWRLPWWVRWPPATVPRALCGPRTVRLAPSAVHGTGVVVERSMRAGAVVGVAIEWRWGLLPVVTRDLGRYLNHSARPTARLAWVDGAWQLVTAVSLVRGDELTVDYGTLPSYCARQP